MCFDNAISLYLDKKILSEIIDCMNFDKFEEPSMDETEQNFTFPLRLSNISKTN